MLKKVILLSFVVNLLISQIIDHQHDNSIYSNIPLTLEVFTDYNNSDIKSFNIYYKLNNDVVYLKDQLNKLSENYFNYVIPASFINGKYIDYYFLLELSNGTYISYPSENPHNQPISVRIDNMIDGDDEIKSYLDAEYNIITPQENKKVSKDDFVISLSYFTMENLDLNEIKVFIDNKDVTMLAKIRESNLVVIPKKISSGKHTVKVLLSTKDEIKYNPIIWSFFIVDSIDEISDSYFSGKIWLSKVSTKTF